MNKLVKEASTFFQKNQKNLKKEFKKRGISTCIYSTSLTPWESDQLEKLIKNEPDVIDIDYSNILSFIKEITCQIKAIQKQHVLLIGEKIHKARELFRTIGSSETTFSLRLGLVFHVKSSAYNALAYYELFSSLPDDRSKSLLQTTPYKTAYLLASRHGSLETKMNVLEKIQGLPNTPAILVLNKHLPSLREICTTQSNVSHECVNKLISDKILELLKIVCSNVQLSIHNINLLKQLFDTTIKKTR